MSGDVDLYYLCQPKKELPVAQPVEFVSAQDFLRDEQACRELWELVASQFRTRSKFLTIWQSVRFVTHLMKRFVEECRT
jgi:hypothetical protein